MMHRWFTVTIALLVLGGCATRPPQVHTDVPALLVPPAPPRVIVPPEPDPVPEPPLPEPENVPVRPARRTAPRPDPKAAPGAKSETPPAATEASPLPPVTPPAESLEPVLPTSASQVERSVKQQLQRASGDLGRVDYGALSQDGKQQYDMAKRFIEQAGVALGERNLVFAGKLAEKAGGIASLLLGR
ncbi:MAG TPA: hypothetical protein VK911_07505 [Vicinamibacterales bacterium]|nr:hypothetical protein [Vicinamibacterales bacterium]